MWAGELHTYLNVLEEMEILDRCSLAVGRYILVLLLRWFGILPLCCYITTLLHNYRSAATPSTKIVGNYSAVHTSVQLQTYTSMLSHEN